MTIVTPSLHSFKSWRPDRLRALVNMIGGDGHSILDPYPLAEELKLSPAEAVRLGALSIWHESDGTAKGTIDGDVEMQMFGAYTLHIIRAIARDLGAVPKGRIAMGRGSEARQLSEVILTTLALQQLPVDAENADLGNP